jgi:hypothetical protein
MQSLRDWRRFGVNASITIPVVLAVAVLPMLMVVIASAMIVSDHASGRGEQCQQTQDIN